MIVLDEKVTGWFGEPPRFGDGEERKTHVSDRRHFLSYLGPSGSSSDTRIIKQHGSINHLSSILYQSPSQEAILHSPFVEIGENLVRLLAIPRLELFTFEDGAFDCSIALIFHGHSISNNCCYSHFFCKTFPSGFQINGQSREIFR